MNAENNIVVGDSIHGKGIFSTKHIKAGNVICTITGGPPSSFYQTVKLLDKECYYMQVDMDQYILPDYPFYLSNHSCDPNCGITEQMKLIAIKDIKEGEELQWDYSTSMLERYWTMECKCGSPLCRKQIVDFDLLPVALQKKYIDLKIVLPFILKNTRFFQLPDFKMETYVAWKRDMR